MKTCVLNGNRVVVGHIYPFEQLRTGTWWAQADGADRTVQIRALKDNNVQYGTYAGDSTYEANYFDFQTRYCLIIED